MGLIFHMYNHTTENNIKKRVRHLEDLVITVSSAITELSCKRNSTNSISYGTKTTDLNKFNDFIIENSEAIQFIVNSEINVLSRYTDVNSIIEYIKIQQIEEDIIQGNIHNIASNFVSLNFSKKLGAIKKKKTIDILQSQAFKNYSQYIITSKHINHIQTQNNNKYSMPQKHFNKIPKIQSLVYFILKTILYNNKQQIIDDLQISEKHLHTAAYKQKKYLSKLHLILKYINKFKYLTNGIIVDNNRKIMNFLQFIIINNLLSLDKLFCQFENELDSWMPNHVIYVSHEPTRIHSSTNKNIIIIDDYEVVQFSIPASNNCNDAIILACLISMETKRTACLKKNI
ncbi:Uncharacterized protein FWK35_00032789 [Aphis craccivora]|uniref:Uncharacterized protein n=1 Tax=Aphis craccivora TaxID=307492 RepID=A0A6G0VPT8_APHCR|nr:Uncharacterized protein FWK35_00032789 [Aphis craccivora]